MPPSKPKKRRSPRVYKNHRGVLRRDELFEVLQCEIATNGWKDLSLRKIARGMGISLGLIHHHFAGRDAIARSFYEDVCSTLGHFVESMERAGFAEIFRGFMEKSLDEHAFIGCAYADAVRDAFYTGRPLPSLSLVFTRLAKRATDLDGYEPPIWLIALVHQRLIERRLFGEPRDEVMASVEAIAPVLATMLHQRDGSIRSLQDDLDLAARQMAGTEWHDAEVRRSLALGLPSRNPRRARDAQRRAGLGA